MDGDVIDGSCIAKALGLNVGLLAAPRIDAGKVLHSQGQSTETSWTKCGGGTSRQAGLAVALKRAPRAPTSISSGDAAPLQGGTAGESLFEDSWNE